LASIFGQYPKKAVQKGIQKSMPKKWWKKTGTRVGDQPSLFCLCATAVAHK
jgi:hypothetical protein